MLRSLLIISLFASLIFFPDFSGAKAMDERVYIVPAGTVDKEIIAKIKDRLPGSLHMKTKVIIDQPLKMPEAAYDPSRKQYDARKALDEAARNIPLATSMERGLVIIDADLYASELNFVFGLADAKKGVCIVALARLRNEFYGLKPDERLFIERVIKEAVHELGHSYGLDHCPRPKCVMFFSNSLQDTDRKRDAFCVDCRMKLDKRFDSGPLFGKGSK